MKIEVDDWGDDWRICLYVPNLKYRWHLLRLRVSKKYREDFERRKTETITLDDMGRWAADPDAAYKFRYLIMSENELLKALRSDEGK